MRNKIIVIVEQIMSAKKYTVLSGIKFWNHDDWRNKKYKHGVVNLELVEQSMLQRR
jgi:hypothetical protein